MDNLKIKVKVFAGKAKFSTTPVCITKEGEFQVFTKNEAINGKANLEVKKLLAKHFRVSVDCVKIKIGLNSKNKIIEIKL